MPERPFDPRSEGRSWGRSGREGGGVVDEPDAQGLADQKDFGAGGQAREVAQLAAGEIAGLVAAQDGDRAPLALEPDGIRAAVEARPGGGADLDAGPIQLR